MMNSNSGMKSPTVVSKQLFQKLEIMPKCLQAAECPILQQKAKSLSISQKLWSKSWKNMKTPTVNLTSISPWFQLDWIASDRTSNDPISPKST